MWNFLKRKIKQPEQIINAQKLPDNNFYCHYCHKPIEVTSSMQFPTSVPSCDGQYHYQGIGVICPYCKKVCIYG